MDWEELADNQSYTDIDIEDVRAKLVNYVKNATDQWTNFNESDIGMIYIELASGIADILGFRLDNQALETYLPTAKQRKNVKSILSLINYQMNGLVPARTTLRFTLANGGTYPEDIVIPKYLQVTGSPEGSNTTIYYATAQEAVLKAGSLYVDIPAIQGELITQTYTVADIITNSRFYLNTTTLAEGTTEVTINDNEWQEVDDVTKEIDDTQTYSVEEDRYDRAYILFHRNFASMMPSDTSAPVKFRFLNTLAQYGEVKAGVLNRIEDDLTTTDGNLLSATLNVTNTENSSGSAARETADHARAMGPAKLTTIDRAITIDDYNNLLNSYPGIAKAIALDWNSPDYVDEPYRVDCYIVPTGMVDVSDAQLNDIKEYLEERKVSTIHLNVMSAEYVDVDIKAEVYVNATEDQFSTIETDIEAALIDYFSPDNQDFSTGIKTSAILTLMQLANPYVDYINLTSPTTTNLKLNQFPKLTSIDLTTKVSGSDA